MPRFVGHLPLVRLEPGIATFPTHAGRLHAVAFEEWHAYDSSFPFGGRDYEQTAPCFFERQLPAGVDSDAEREQFESGQDAASADLALCHEALLLVTGERYPVPAVSTSYLIFDGDDIAPEHRGVVLSSHQARVGPAERELIVHGSQERRVPLDRATLQQLETTWDQLARRGADVAPAVDALVRTSRPGYTPLNETMHLVAGLEALLVERGEPLGSTFARRYVVLATDSDVDPMLKHAKFLYGLRSDVIHGRPMPALTSEWEDFLWRDHRLWTCLIVRRLLTWLVVTDRALDALRHSLDEAYESSRSLAELRAVWGRLGD